MTKKAAAENSLIIKPAGRLGDVQEYYFSQKLREIARMRAEGKPVLNLGIGSPDLPPASEVVEALTNNALFNDVHGYQSYNGIPELRQAFARWYEQWFGVGLDPEGEVLPLIGSKEGLMHIAMSFLEPGDEVLVPNPGYPAYRAVSNLAGATVREYMLEEERGWLPDLEALGRQDLSRVKILWVNYPNMPTGANAGPDFFRELVAFAQRHRILVVNDNPYAFILNNQLHSILSVPGAAGVALELNSLSKAHNMAGWRIGMLAGRRDYLQVVLRFKSNMDSGMFRPLQMAAVRALQSPPEWYGSLNAVYAERRDTVFQLLDTLGCSYDPGQVGMFVWAKVPLRYASGYELSDEVLYGANVFLTPGGIFGSAGDPYIRISLCSDGVLYEEAIRRVANLQLI
ncbi:MAG: aminotransferase class I/II-fold pyridoxal phosphate-dependent enzyme [Lewinellaceae bacterium]|nr:aminotransferase class I/II-fold pyridoxal phosphate-dependent enzyme [Lewinellaceae bacterium]